MKSWYGKIEGTGKPRDNITSPFGFFVHCVVWTANRNDAREAITQSLSDDDMSVVQMIELGAFEQHEWDHDDFRAHLSDLQQKAFESPGVPYFTEFHTWPL